MNLSPDRRWCLSWWERDGWSIGRPNQSAMAKWKRHMAALVKAGLLEADEYGMHRITEAGRQALKEQGETPWPSVTP